MAVTGGPVAMLPPMARALMTGAMPPAGETLVQAALTVTARTVRARMLLVVIAG